MSTLLQVMDVTKIYKKQPKPGLDHVSFEVKQGEFLYEILVIWTAATSFNGFDKCPACEGKDEKMLAGQYLEAAMINTFVSFFTRS